MRTFIGALFALGIAVALPGCQLSAWSVLTLRRVIF